MRSLHAETYNHDEEAEGYDNDVADEEHPIRCGYAEVLNWVADRAEVTQYSRVLELGSGTGNLTTRLHAQAEILCVDVSERMEALAGQKLRHLSNRSFVNEDILAVFDRDIGSFDRIVSTYTVHHLTESEKEALFTRTWEHLLDDGIATFGDLMVRDESDLKAKLKHYRRTGQADVVEGLEEEFFWRIEHAQRTMREIGFDVVVRRFSDLSFGVAARKSKDQH